MCLLYKHVSFHTLYLERESTIKRDEKTKSSNLMWAGTLQSLRSNVNRNFLARYWLKGSEPHYNGHRTNEIQIIRWGISHSNLHESVMSQKISS